MDGPPAVALGVEKRHGNVMGRPPRPVDEGLPKSRDISLIFYLGAVMVIGTLIIFYLSGGGVITDDACSVGPLDTGEYNWMESCLAGEESGISDWNNHAEDLFSKAQTMTFAVFIIYQLFNVLNCRSGDASLFTLGVFSNKAINYAILISASLLFVFVNFASSTIPLVGIEFGNLLSTISLKSTDWFVLTLVASTVFLIEEFRKFMVNNGFFNVRR